jgi:hypothetical protein
MELLEGFIEQKSGVGNDGKGWAVSYDVVKK